VGKCVVFMGPVLHHLHLEVVMSIDYHYWGGGVRGLAGCGHVASLTEFR